MVDRVNSLIENSLAPSSYASYNRAWTLFHNCMNELGIDFQFSKSLPLSPNQVLLFVGYLDVKDYSPNSLYTYISALSYIHKLKAYPDPTISFSVQKAISGAVKNRRSLDTRRPITVDILKKMVAALQHTVTSLYLRALFRAMYSVSFFALMRIGEVTVDTQGAVAIFFHQVTFQQNHLTISITHFKHNLSNQPFDLVVTPQNDHNICPIKALLNYFTFRGTANGPLFCFSNLRPIPREFFTRHLRQVVSFCQLEPGVFKSHSFRIGGASHYAEMGFSDEQIRLMGRWKSTAFRKYIRSQKIIAALN